MAYDNLRAQARAEGQATVEALWRLRVMLATTPSEQVTLALDEGHPFWMKYEGERVLSYDIDPCRRVWMLSDVWQSNWSTSPGSWWRWRVDADAGRTMKFVRR